MVSVAVIHQDNNVMFTLSVAGSLSVAVPGELLGYWEAKQKFGNPEVTWASLIEPTIKLCEEGIEVTDYLAKVGKADRSMKKLKGDSALGYIICL